uniref:E2 ubiquitin-conjugating enzyme n=1 Tax=Eptatretus burgeri TaxID=7764 RepID=A0A8C4QX54_EPTBU
MSLASLKQELKLLESIFDKNHERFRIDSCCVDELACRFVSADCALLIRCTIAEEYPVSPPIWFAESEDPHLAAVLEKLGGICSGKTVLLQQLKRLLTDLCKLYGLPQHPDIEMLDQPLPSEQICCSFDLNKKGTVSGSVQATDRLMKELRDIYRSASFKGGNYAVELVNDSLYEWNVKILKVDPDSALHSDLLILKEKEEKCCISMNFSFRDNFPFDPPFVRVVSPILTGGYVLGGGAICMELLTKQGWSSAYSIESVIMQISATLVKGKARIQFGANTSQYSLARAQQSFKSLVQIHEKNGMPHSAIVHLSVYITGSESYQTHSCRANLRHCKYIRGRCWLMLFSCGEIPPQGALGKTCMVAV